MRGAQISTLELGRVGGGGLLCCLYRNEVFFFFSLSIREEKRAGAMMCAGSTTKDGLIPTCCTDAEACAHKFGIALVRQPRSALPGSWWCRRHLSGTRQEGKVDSLGGGGGRRRLRGKGRQGHRKRARQRNTGTPEERQAWVSKTAIGKSEARGGGVEGWNQGKRRLVMFQLCSGWDKR